ncbi:hypothetical protein GCM10027577_10900 [Spirosoma fluminis]
MLLKQDPEGTANLSDSHRLPHQKPSAYCSVDRNLNKKQITKLGLYSFPLDFIINLIHHLTGY